VAWFLRVRERIGSAPQDRPALAEKFLLFPLILLVADLGPGIHVVDVGQGNAMLIIGRGGEVVAFDSGPSGGAEAILAALSAHQVDRVSLWIHTHFDADHVGGFGRVRAGMDAAMGTEDDIEVEVAWDRGLAGAPTTASVLVYASLGGYHNHRQQPQNP
jgi:competence protein ComEC